MIPGPRPPLDDEPDRDRALADSARAGDRDAFGELYQAYAGELYTYVRSRVYSHELAQDIVHDTFARALRRIGTFTTWTGGGFPAWITTIARNAIADHYRSSRHQLETTRDEWFDSDIIYAGFEDTLIDDDATAAAHAAVRAAIARLIPTQRACIEARFLDGLPLAEAAERLGLKEGAVKTLQWRATKTLGRDSALIGALTA